MATSAKLCPRIRGNKEKTMSIGADAVKLAGLQVDLLQKVQNGSISLEMVKQGRDFERTKPER